MAYEFKNLNEVEYQASITENTTVMGFENGVPVQISASGFGNSGGKVFVIDSTADDYSTTDATYGNTVKEALLRGDKVWIYQYETYTDVLAFRILESTTGEVSLIVYPSAQVNTEGLVANTSFYGPYSNISFAITL